jgi:hypothetical protein
MNVFVIPEDFRNDQFILQPLIKAMIADLGAPKAKVVICRDPLLGGITEALKFENLEGIVRRYRGMVDLFILCVDRDGDPNRRAALDGLERRIGGSLEGGRAFFAEHAWQEIEVWVLAGHDLPAEWVWAEIRSEHNPKERYFEPFARSQNVSDGPGGGRKALADAAARRLSRICQLCREDFAALRNRISTYVAG